MTTPNRTPPARRSGPRADGPTLPDGGLDADAVEIIRTLQRAGYTAYLVGGCVRDLLLGRRPKDFDVATTATPNELRRLFRNCRIIGRRFRLAHLYFGSKIIEVATFRGRASEAVLDSNDGNDDVIERTNTFGTPEQDARSRDFTMNALFYDPIARQLIDFVGGLPDVYSCTIRTIGDPRVRLAEDPIRILRAIKFAARLGCGIEDEAAAAMREHAGLIPHCPAPRVLEEIFRLLEAGHARRSLELMREQGILDVVLPELVEYLTHGSPIGGRTPWEALTALATGLDRMARAHDGVSRDFILTALYYLPALEVLRGAEDSTRLDWTDRADEWFAPIARRQHTPVRLRTRFFSVMGMMQRFLDTSRRRRRVRTAVHAPAFSQAMALLRLHIELFGEGAEAYEAWAELGTAEGVYASPWGPARPERGSREGGDGPPAGEDGAKRGRRRGGRRRGGRPR